MMLSIFLLLILLGSVYLLWENTHFTVTGYVYRNPKVPKEMDGLRILQISDLHNQSFGKNNRRLLARIRKEKPPVIVITGDLIDSTFTDTEKAIAFAAELTALAPVYYCTGNHEHRLPKPELDAFLEELSHTGVRVLQDEAVSFYGGILVGLQDPSSKTDALSRILKEEDPDTFTLLLSHKPHRLKHYLQADLVLAGHAHGGQVYIPFLGGLIAPGQGYFPKYTKGFYTMEATTMLVSRGIGNSHRIPRLFNPPELVLLTLRCQ